MRFYPLWIGPAPCDVVLLVIRLLRVLLSPHTLKPLDTAHGRIYSEAVTVRRMAVPFNLSVLWSMNTPALKFLLSPRLVGRSGAR